MNICGKVGEDYNRRCAIIIAAISSFITPFMGSSINIALPSIGAEFSMDAVTLGWVPMAFLLSAAVFLVPFGRLADIHGRKRIFGYGIALFTLSTLVAAASTSPAMLILARAAQGTGSAMIFGTGIAILTSVFSPKERGRVLGLNIAVVYLGLSSGPILGGLLTQHLGWRSIFLVTLPLGLVALFMTLFRLEGEWADARGEEFDLPGSAIFGLAVVAMIYGLSILPERRGIYLSLLGILGLMVFLYAEIRVKSPVLDLHLFLDNRVFAFSNLAALINYSATFATGFLLSLYLQYIKGLDPRTAGLILVAQPIMMTLVSPFAGRLSDRKDPRIVATVGMAFTFLGILPFAVLREETSLAYVVGSLMVLGFGLGMFSSPNTNAVMSSVSRKFYGVASATLGTMRLFGQMLSMGLAMLVFALYIGRVEITPQSHFQFLMATRTAFAIFAVLCALGILASLARGNQQTERS
ncbi:MAG: MFS transporter [Methanosarcinales archaeon]|nr:MFS transporter [Methanosarcinales archaeon]